MAKKVPSAASDSSLSAPPDGVTVTTAGSAATKTVASRPKRKAETINTSTKRAKQAPVQEPKTEKRQLVWTVRPSSRSSPIRRTIAEDNVVEENSQAEADRAGKAPAKKSKRQTKSAKKEEPLEERTKDTKLRIGAHVSSAGGKIHLRLPRLLIPNILFDSRFG